MKTIILALILISSVSQAAPISCTTDTDCMYAVRSKHLDFKITKQDRVRCDGWMDWSDEKAEKLSNVQQWCDDAGL